MFDVEFGKKLIYSNSGAIVTLILLSKTGVNYIFAFKKLDKLEELFYVNSIELSEF